MCGLQIIAMYVVVLRANKALSTQMEKLDQDFFDEADIYSPDTHVDMRTGRRNKKERANITYKLKIMVGFFQIATNLAFVVEAPVRPTVMPCVVHCLLSCVAVQWPSGYAAFI